MPMHELTEWQTRVYTYSDTLTKHTPIRESNENETKEFTVASDTSFQILTWIHSFSLFRSLHMNLCTSCQNPNIHQIRNKRGVCNLEIQFFLIRILNNFIVTFDIWWIKCGQYPYISKRHNWYYSGFFCFWCSICLIKIHAEFGSEYFGLPQKFKYTTKLI